MTVEFIHVVQRKDGSLRYREFSETSGLYQTPSLTENEMILYLLSSRFIHYGSPSVTDAIISPSLNLEHRLRRAREQGTSEEEVTRRLDRWERRPIDYWGTRFPEEKTKKAFLADLENRLNKPLRELIYEELERERSSAREYREKDIPQIERLQGILGKG